MPKYLLRVKDIRTKKVIVEKEVEAQDDVGATEEGHIFLKKTRREVSGAAWLVDVMRVVIAIEE